MAQGKTKGLQQKAPSARHAARAAAAPKKGKRIIPPKKAAAVKQAAMHKVRFLLQTELHSKSLSVGVAFLLVLCISANLHPRSLVFFELTSLSCVLTVSVCKNRQVDRTTNDLCRIVWNSHHNEKRSAARVSSRYALHSIHLTSTKLFFLCSRCGTQII